MAAPLFSSTNQPANRRLRVTERHADVITRAQDLMAGSLEQVAAAAVQIATGNAVEHLINHKTGVVHEVPVQPATQLKAIQFVTERIAGKPESTKTHEIGEGAAGLFKVLLGKSAEEHWAPPALDAGYVEVPVGVLEAQTEAEALEAAPAPGLLTERS